MLALASGLFLLAGCAAAPPAEPAASPSPSSAPGVESEPIPTPGPLEPTTLLVLTATATAAGGAQLALELRVVQSTSFDDVASQTLPAGLIQDCAGRLTDTQFAQESWSFTRANLVAIPTDAAGEEWPADSRIGVLPSAASAPVAGRGILALESVDPATAPCEQDKSFASYGTGGIAFGIPGDSGTFTGWARHAYGFTTGSDVTLSDCSAQTTELGSSLGGNAPTWSTVATGSTCAVGTLPEAKEY